MKIIDSIKCRLGYHEWKELKREWRFCGRCAAEVGDLQYTEHLYVTYKCQCCPATETRIEAFSRKETTSQ